MQRSGRKKTDQLLQLEGLNLKTLWRWSQELHTLILPSFHLFTVPLYCLSVQSACCFTSPYIMLQTVTCAPRARLLCCPCCGWIWVECSLRAVVKLIKFHKYYIFFICLQLSQGKKNLVQYLISLKHCGSCRLGLNSVLMLKHKME